MMTENEPKSPEETDMLEKPTEPYFSTVKRWRKIRQPIEEAPAEKEQDQPKQGE